MNPLRRAARARLLATLRRRARRWNDDELRAPALVLAPHPDDETLGCGGTVVQKRRAGARVLLVFATDGTASHRVMPSAELAAARRSEALAAAAALGVPSQDVAFLDFADGELAQHRAAAVEQIAALLRQGSYTQLFAPWARDGRLDHDAAFSVLHAAARAVATPCALFQYPVWFWHRWPWIDRRGTPHAWRRVAADAVRWLGATAFGLHCVVDVTDAIEQKRGALQCHRTQTARQRDDVPWPVLADVADGEWLECFFTGFEAFRRQDLR